MKKLITLMMLVTITLASCTKENVQPKTEYFFKLVTLEQSDKFDVFVNFQLIENNENFIVKSGDNVLIVKNCEINIWFLHYHTSDWTIDTENWEEQVTTITPSMIPSDEEIIFNKTME